MAVKARRAGNPSEFGPDSTWPELKPEFYADSRMLSENALRVFEDLKTTNGPYGLVDRDGNTISTLRDGGDPWIVLAGALKTTARIAVERAQPGVYACPYHEAIASKLGSTAIPLAPLDGNSKGLDTLRGVVEPGAVFASTLTTSLIRRLPALQALHGDRSDHIEFAHNSVSLLREPLRHPQQRATAFVMSLGTLRTLASPRFLDDELALAYTKVESDPSGGNRLAWAMPTEDFTLLANVSVPSRTQGSERDRQGDHIRSYPIGTRLGDIEVDEPTLGCPGNQFASSLWHRSVDIAAQENLWDAV